MLRPDLLTYLLSRPDLLTHLLAYLLTYAPLEAMMLAQGAGMLYCLDGALPARRALGAAGFGEQLSRVSKSVGGLHVVQLSRVSKSVGGLHVVLGEPSALLDSVSS